MIEEILAFNKSFVGNKDYERYLTSKFPEKRIAIVSCMDTRLTELLPAALGLRNGDVKIIKNAGGVISHPFGSAMRSLLIGIYELEVEEILVIGHTDCGAKCTDSRQMIEKMKARSINQSIMNTVALIQKHPLVPEGIRVWGLVIDSETGELNVVI